MRLILLETISKMFVRFLELNNNQYFTKKHT